MTKKLRFLLWLFFSISAFSQVGIGTTSPHPSSMLDITATDKSLLIPRVPNTAAIANPVNGMIVYDISYGCFRGYQSGYWSGCLGNNGTISSLDCAGATTTGTLFNGLASNGISSIISYTGGNGGSHAGQTVTSTGVLGLTATTYGGSFATGSGTLQYFITGTPTSSGTASFAINIGGQSCTLNLTVLDGISTLDCAGATITGTLIIDTPATGVSASLAYTGGIGTSHNGQTVTSTGVTGLTATLPAGTFANGSGNLVYTITGAPTSSGTASFAISIGGQSCTLNIPVNNAITSLDCAGATITGNLIEGTAASGVTASIDYTGGLGTNHNGQTVTSTGVTGLTATLSAGTFANGAGNLVYTITGTPSGSGTASFAINIGGQSCILNITALSGIIATLDCAGAVITGSLMEGIVSSGVSASIDYTGGYGTYDAQNISSTGVTGLTATLNAGVFSSNGNLTFTITGTPSGSGTASFAINIGGQSCTLNITVYPIGVITTLDCAGATTTGTLMLNVAASGVSSAISYTGGNGGYHNGQTVSSTGVTGLTATLDPGFFSIGNGTVTYVITGTPTSNGTANFAINIGGQSCTLSILIETIPPTITLDQNGMYIFASVYDQNYLPFTMPTLPATSTTPVNPDGVNEPVTADYQGTITTTGITVRIKVVTTGTGTLPAYSNTITIPASLTEDGISRDLTLSWTAQAFTTATKSITATIKAVGGTLNAKKLDINEGLGNDFLGIVLGSFTYPYNNAGNLTAYQVRLIPGIPDKMFGKPDNSGNSSTHMMLYLPVVAEDGNVWLNNNLGAHYANLNHPNFNLAQQATSDTDYLAYGSLFQWGRKPDGHELINFTSNTTGTPVYGNSYSQNNNPPHSNFIVVTTPPQYYWTVSNITNYWSTEASANNPCPYGFKVPSKANFDNLVTSLSGNGSSSLKFSRNGMRFNGTGGLLSIGSFSGYLSSQEDSFLNAVYTLVSSSSTNSGTVSSAYYRSYGIGVRCIKN